MYAAIDVSDKNDKNTQDVSDRARYVRQNENDTVARRPGRTISALTATAEIFRLDDHDSATDYTEMWLRKLIFD